MPKDITITDVKLRGEITLIWDGTAVQVEATYLLVDAAGQSYGRRTHQMPLTAAQQTQLRSFVQTALLPSIRAAEGLT